MAQLLTINGIPPQIVGSLTECARISFAQCEKTIQRWQNGEMPIGPAKPFAALAASVVDSFVQWGATLEGKYAVSLIASYVEKGKTTFAGETNLHSDARYAEHELMNENRLHLRLLCVSNTPSKFVDLTAHENMSGIMEQFRLAKGRIYNPALMDLAQNEERLVKPKAWDIIAYDAITPHNPKGVAWSRNRILQSAWIEMRLPDDWQDRVKSGNIPKLQLG